MRHVRTAPRGADCRVAAGNCGPDVRGRPEDLDSRDDACGHHDRGRCAGAPDGAGRPPPGLHLCQGHAQRCRLRLEGDRRRAGLCLEHGRRADARPGHAGGRHGRADDRPAPHAAAVPSSGSPRAPPTVAGRGSGSLRSPPTRSRLPAADRREEDGRQARQPVVKRRLSRTLRRGPGREGQAEGRRQEARRPRRRQAPARVRRSRARAASRSPSRR